MSIADLAREVNLSRPQVSAIINNLRKVPINQVKLILYTLGFSKAETDAMAKEYEDFYELANNNEDFKMLSLISKYHVGIWFDDSTKTETNDPNHIVLGIIMAQGNTTYKITFSVRGYQGAKKDKIEIYLVDSTDAQEKSTKLKNLSELCSAIGLKPQSFLNLFEFEFIRQVKNEKTDILSRRISITDNFLSENMEVFQKYLAGFNLDSGSAFKDSGNNSITEPRDLYMKGSQDLYDYLNKCFERQKETRNLTTKLYPLVFQIMKEDLNLKS